MQWHMYLTYLQIVEGCKSDSLTYNQRLNFLWLTLKYFCIFVFFAWLLCQQIHVSQIKKKEPEGK